MKYNEKAFAKRLFGILKQYLSGATGVMVKCADNGLFSVSVNDLQFVVTVVQREGAGKHTPPIPPKPDPEVQKKFHELEFLDFCAGMSLDEKEFAEYLNKNQFLGYQKLRYAGWPVKNAYHFCQQPLAATWDKIDYTWLMQFVPILGISHPGADSELKKKLDDDQLAATMTLSAAAKALKTRLMQVQDEPKPTGANHVYENKHKFTVNGSVTNGFMQVQDGKTNPEGTITSASMMLAPTSFFYRLKLAWHLLWTPGFKNVILPNDPEKAKWDLMAEQAEKRFERASQKAPVNVTNHEKWSREKSFTSAAIGVLSCALNNAPRYSVSERGVGIYEVSGNGKLFMITDMDQASDDTTNDLENSDEMRVKVAKMTGALEYDSEDRLPIPSDQLKQEIFQIDDIPEPEIETGSFFTFG
jgi:hypothetical protein